MKRRRARERCQKKDDLLSHSMSIHTENLWNMRFNNEIQTARSSVNQSVDGENCQLELVQYSTDYRRKKIVQRTQSQSEKGRKKIQKRG